jgi:MOSC domain-containing protein YiiM
MFTPVDVHTHRSAEQLAAGMPHIDAAPRDTGTLDVLVRRPAVNERDVLEVGELSLTEGLVGDTWSQRSSRRTPDGSPHPDMQLNVMSSRVLAALADRERWQLAGDQLLVDLDLSPENLPTGTRLEIGTAVIEVTDQPHTGCAKFAERFGPEALRFVNTGAGAERRFRGLNAKVVQPGSIRPGDTITVVRR